MKIAILAVSMAATLTAINQISIVITVKRLWQQQQQLRKEKDNDGKDLSQMFCNAFRKSKLLRKMRNVYERT